MANIDVTQMIAQIEQIAKTHKIELPQSFYKIKARANDPMLYVGLIGEFSSGKSTLVNAWLGDNVLKTDALQATTAAPTVVKAESEYRIGTLLSNGDKIFSQKFSQEIAFKAKLLDFLHKVSAQEEYSKDIKLVSLSYPNKVLENKGFALIDTPGANAENERHKKISGWAIEEICDVAIVIIPADIPYSESLNAFIKTCLGKSLQKCVFVITKIDSIPEDELDPFVVIVKKRIESSLGIKIPEIPIFSPRFYLDVKSGKKEITEENRHFISEFEENTEKLFKLLYEKRDEYFYITLSEILKSLTEKLQSELRTKRDEYQKRIDYINANMLPDFDGWLQKNSTECRSFIFQNLSKQVVEAKLVEKKNRFIATLANEINALESKDEIKQYMTADNIQQKINANAAEMGRTINDYLQNITTSAFNKFSEEFTQVYKNLATVAIKSNSNYNFSYSHRDTSSSITAVENTVANVFSSEETAGSVGSVVGGILGGVLGLLVGNPLIGVAAVKGLAEVGSDLFSMFVTKGHLQKKSIEQLTAIIENTYFLQILSSTTQKLDQFLSAAGKSVDEITAKYRKSYQQLIDNINKKNVEEKRDLETFSKMAETSISYLSRSQQELASSNKIAISSDAKYSYLDKIAQILRKDFTGESRHTQEIANLLGYSAKVIKYGEPEKRQNKEINSGNTYNLYGNFGNQGEESDSEKGGCLKYTLIAVAVATMLFLIFYLILLLFSSSSPENTNEPTQTVREEKQTNVEEETVTPQIQPVFTLEPASYELNYLYNGFEAFQKGSNAKNEIKKEAVFKGKFISPSGETYQIPGPAAVKHSMSAFYNSETLVFFQESFGSDGVSVAPYITIEATLSGFEQGYEFSVGISNNNYVQFYVNEIDNNGASCLFLLGFGTLKVDSLHIAQGKAGRFTFSTSEIKLYRVNATPEGDFTEALENAGFNLCVRNAD